MYTRRLCPKVNILSILHSLCPQKRLLFHVASSVKPLSHVYSRPITSPFVDKLNCNECLKFLPLCHKSNLIKKCNMSQPWSLLSMMQYKVKKIFQTFMYTTNIAIACFLRNRNRNIIFLSWQLFVFISLVMQKYSK